MHRKCWTKKSLFISDHSEKCRFLFSHLRYKSEGFFYRIKGTPTWHYSSYKWSGSASVLRLVGGSNGERRDVLYSTPFGADIRHVTLPVVTKFTCSERRTSPSLFLSLFLSRVCRWEWHFRRHSAPLCGRHSSRGFRTRYLLHHDVHENEKGGVLCKFARWKSHRSGHLSMVHSQDGNRELGREVRRVVLVPLSWEMSLESIRNARGFLSRSTFSVMSPIDREK